MRYLEFDINVSKQTRAMQQSAREFGMQVVRLLESSWIRFRSSRCDCRTLLLVGRLQKIPRTWLP